MKRKAATLSHAFVTQLSSTIEAITPDWLAQPFVKCVGGSWVIPKGSVDVAQVEKLARAAARLAGN